MKHLQTNPEHIPLNFIPKEKEGEFIKAVLESYKYSHEFDEQFNSVTLFNYLEVWDDIAVFLQRYYLIGCCYKETGEDAFEKMVDDISKEGVDGFEELEGIYGTEWFSDWREEFRSDVMMVLDFHNYSYIDYMASPISGNPICIEVKNKHFIEVW